MPNLDPNEPLEIHIPITSDVSGAVQAGAALKDVEKSVGGVAEAARHGRTPLYGLYEVLSGGVRGGAYGAAEALRGVARVVTTLASGPLAAAIPVIAAMASGLVAMKVAAYENEKAIKSMLAEGVTRAKEYKEAVASITKEYEKLQKQADQALSEIDEKLTATMDKIQSAERVAQTGQKARADLAEAQLNLNYQNQLSAIAKNPNLSPEQREEQSRQATAQYQSNLATLRTGNTKEGLALQEQILPQRIAALNEAISSDRGVLGNLTTEYAQALQKYDAMRKETAGKLADLNKKYPLAALRARVAELEKDPRARIVDPMAGTGSSPLAMAKAALASAEAGYTKEFAALQPETAASEAQAQAVASAKANLGKGELEIGKRNASREEQLAEAQASLSAIPLERQAANANFQAGDIERARSMSQYIPGLQNRAQGARSRAADIQSQMDALTAQGMQDFSIGTSGWNSRMSALRSQLAQANTEADQAQSAYADYSGSVFRSGGFIPPSAPSVSRSSAPKPSADFAIDFGSSIPASEVEHHARRSLDQQEKTKQAVIDFADRSRKKQKELHDALRAQGPNG